MPYANPEEAKAYRRRYYLANRDEALMKAKSRYEEKRGEIREKQKDYYRSYYADNRERLIAQTSANRKANAERYNSYKASYVRRNRIWCRSYLAENPCVDCGEADPIVLEFDHVSGDKEFMLSQGCASGLSLQRIRAEVAKCEVRCANCHKRRHKEASWYVD